LRLALSDSLVKEQERLDYIENERLEDSQRAAAEEARLQENARIAEI